MTSGLFPADRFLEGILALALWQVSKTTIVMSAIEIPGNCTARASSRINLIKIGAETPSKLLFLKASEMLDWAYFFFFKRHLGCSRSRWAGMLTWHIQGTGARGLGRRMC